MVQLCTCMLNKEKHQVRYRIKRIWESYLHNNEFPKWEGQFNEYVLDVKEKGTDLARFWLSYLELCELMLNLNYATRIGSWEL